MDPLSITASVIAIIQLTSQIYSSCQQYYSNVKSARKDIDRISNEINNLAAILKKLHTVIESSMVGIL